MQVSESCLQEYVNKKYEEVPEEIEEPPDCEETELTMECDETWSFLQNKSNKKWIWLARDRHSGNVVGYYVGDRSADGARRLWNSSPKAYKEKAHCFADFWDAYAKPFPKGRHTASGKGDGQTNRIERFNGTMRARISRLLRLSHAFSKKLKNHVDAIWNFIHHYNRSVSSI